MANRILRVTPEAVTFAVDAQTYKAGRFTMPAEVRHALRESQP